MRRLVAKITLVTLSFFGLFIFGCVSYSGNKIIADKSVTSQIKPGVTTKNEVRTLCGEPTNVEFIEGDEEIWSYFYYKTKQRGANYIPLVDLVAGGSDTVNHNLIIKFNKDGIVKKFGTGSSAGGGGGIQDLND